MLGHATERARARRDRAKSDRASPELAKTPMALGWQPTVIARLPTYPRRVTIYFDRFFLTVIARRSIVAASLDFDLCGIGTCQNQPGLLSGARFFSSRSSLADAPPGIPEGTLRSTHRHRPKHPASPAPTTLPSPIRIATIRFSPATTSPSASI